MTTSEQIQTFIRSGIERTGERLYERHGSHDPQTLTYSDCDYNLFLPVTLGGSVVMQWTGETTADQQRAFSS